MTIEQLLAERERIIAICREHCHSGVNPGAHWLCIKVLNAMGEAVNQKEESK